MLCKMANAFELHWGRGEPGTVATEYLTEGTQQMTIGHSNNNTAGIST